MSFLRSPLFLVLSWSALWLAGPVNAPLFRNEGLRARMAAEALENGRWLVPTLYGEPHLTKPPGMTLSIVACSLPVGRVTPFTARLPSILAGLVIVVMWYSTFLRTFGQRPALLLGLIMPACLLWLDRVPSAEIDLVQAAWVSGAGLALWRVTETDSPGWGWWMAALLCVAGGFMTKWTAPAFFYLTALPYLAARGRFSLLFSRPHLVAVAVACLPCLGWLVYVGQVAGWDLFLDTVSREALLRLSPNHHPRPYPWGELITFPLLFLAACLPWAIGIIPVLRVSVLRNLDDPSRRLTMLCHCWVWANLLFWTVAPGHRPRHVLPLQPPLVALVCVGWLALSARWPFSRPVLGSALALMLVVKIVFVCWILPARDRGVARTGEELNRLVPHDAVLHLGKLKDEGVMFYYGRAARRCVRVPPGEWCLLTEAECRAKKQELQVIARLHDGQGSPLILGRGR